MKIFPAILTLPLLLLFSSCDEDLGCPDAIDLGTYFPTDSAMAYVPYKFVKSIVFVDSTGDQLTFQFAPAYYEYLYWEIPGPCPENYYEPVDYLFYGGHWELPMLNDSAHIQPSVGVFSVMDHSTRKIYDVLTVDLFIPGEGSSQSLDLPVDQRLLRDPEYERVRSAINQVDSLEFFGKTFYHVFHDLLPENQPLKSWYNRETGIVAFRDQFGKLWVFAGSQ